MKSGACPRLWLSIAAQVALLAAAFAAGRYFALAGDGPVMGLLRKVPPAPPAVVLRQEQAVLAKILDGGSSIRRQHQLLDFTAGLDAGAVKALLTDLVAKPFNSANNEATMTLLARWAELDPSAAFAFANDVSESQKSFWILNGVFDSWSARDPASALAAAATLPDRMSRVLGQTTILENVARTDPAGALSTLQQLPLDQQNPVTYTYVFSIWAAQDRDAAMAAALKLPTGDDRQMALKSVASTWATDDPAGALAWINTLPENERESTLETTLGLGVADPHLAADVALKLPANDFNQSFILQRTFENWADQDPTALLTWADANLNGVNYTNATTAALSALGDTDPVAAAARLAQITDPDVLSRAAPAIAKSWAGQDPQAALDWALSLPATNADVRQSALANALDGLTNSNPASAAALIANLTADPAFGGVASKVVASWGAADPQAALAWAEGLPAGSGRDTAVVAGIDQLAQSDVPSAWAAAQQLPGDAGASAMAGVIAAWAVHQPTQAAAALASLPAGSDLDTATTDVAKSWLTQDPAAASPWIMALPPGSARDGAVTQLIPTLGKNDPSAALNLAVSLGDPSTRNAQVVSVAQQWAGKNPGAASAAAQNLLTLPGLSSTQLASLQKIASPSAAH